MTSEYRLKMNQMLASDYVGAHLEDERRVVLIAVDPDEPWEAFRQLRKQMRRRRGSSSAAMGMYHSEGPLGHSAEVIPLSTRRRAG